MPSTVRASHNLFNRLVPQVPDKIRSRYRTSFDEASLDDVISEVLLALAKRPDFCFQVSQLPCQEGVLLFWGFIWPCARNWAMNISRRNAARLEVPIDELSEFREDFETPVTRSPLTACNGIAETEMDPKLSLRLKRIREVLSKHLSDTDQALIKLKYVDGLTTEEIAERIGISRGAIRTRLSRAHNRAESILREHLPGEFE